MEHQSPPNVVSKSAYAQMKSVNRSTVTRWGEAQRIVLDANGDVLVAESEARLAETADPTKAGVVRRHEIERGAPVADLLTPPPAADNADQPAAPRATRAEKSGHYADRVRESARHERAKAENAELDLAERKGLLADTAGVQRAMSEFGQNAYQERKRIDREIYLRIAAEADPDKVLALLSDATERWANAVADQTAAMADAATSTRQ